MDLVSWVQNLDEPVCNSYYAKTLKKGINPTILTLAMNKQ